MKKSTLIKDYSTALVKGFYEKVISIKKLKHPLTKGLLRELFLNDLLINFISTQFGVGTGIIIDSEGNQSKQTDIIIYDNTLLPAILKNSSLGVYPIECVVAIIEVKSILNLTEIVKTEEKYRFLDKELKCYKGIEKDFRIVKGIIGFSKYSISEIKNEDSEWLYSNIKHINAICHVQKCSWIKWYGNYKWVYFDKNEVTFEETKRFVAWILDIAKSLSNKRHIAFSKNYVPWLSEYIRDHK